MELTGQVGRRTGGTRSLPIVAKDGINRKGTKNTNKEGRKTGKKDGLRTAVFSCFPAFLMKFGPLLFLSSLCSWCLGG
jgi:hypothetical protein